MDGFTLLRDVREALQESSTSSFLVDRTTYDYLYEGACEFADRTECLTSTQSITTLASTSAYNLNADFMRMYQRDSGGKLYIKYNDGSADYFIYQRDYEGIVFGNNTTSASIPSNFSIRDNPTQPTTLSSTATAVGASSGGECTLTDSTASFLTTASAGDMVHNLTDGSHGVVLSITSNTALVCALFEGTDNDWTSSDSYRITPAPRLQLVLDPPSSTADHTITVYYIQRPTPVYSSYRAYRFNPIYKNAISSYAVWKYRYRDREPNFGDMHYRIFDSAVRKAAHAYNKTFSRDRFKVNFVKRGYTDASYK